MVEIQQNLLHNWWLSLYCFYNTIFILYPSKRSLFWGCSCFLLKRCFCQRTLFARKFGQKWWIQEEKSNDWTNNLLAEMKKPLVSSGISSSHFRPLIRQLFLTRRPAITVYGVTDPIWWKPEDTKLKTVRWVIALSRGWSSPRLTTNVSFTWSR